MSDQPRISFGRDPRYRGLIGAILTLVLLGLSVQLIAQLLGHYWSPAIASGMELVFLAWVRAAHSEVVPLRGRRAWVFGGPALLAAVGFFVMVLGHWN